MRQARIVRNRITRVTRSSPIDSAATRPRSGARNDRTPEVPNGGIANGLNVQYLQAVQLAGRLDDAGQHELPEHLVTVYGPLESERLVSVCEGIP